jgi:hypothetical protein
MRNNSSPLRGKSPRREGSPMGSAAKLPYTDQQPPRAIGAQGGFDRIEQAEFAKVLKDNIFLERELESAKIEAALKPDFNLLDAFKIFDTRGTGNISVQDIIMALRDNIGFDNFTHDDVYLLFRRHDSNNDGKLNFTEFSNLLLPVSKEYAALLTDRPDFYMSRGVPPSQFFNHDTRAEIRNLWASLFKCERASEVLRVGLRSRPYFNLK